MSIVFELPTEIPTLRGLLITTFLVLISFTIAVSSWKKRKKISFYAYIPLLPIVASLFSEPVDENKLNEILANYSEMTTRLEGKLELLEVISGGFLYSIGGTVFNQASRAAGLNSFCYDEIDFRKYLGKHVVLDYSEKIERFMEGETDPERIKNRTGYCVTRLEVHE